MASSSKTKDFTVDTNLIDFEIVTYQANTYIRIKIQVTFAIEYFNWNF